MGLRGSLRLFSVLQLAALAGCGATLPGEWLPLQDAGGGAALGGRPAAGGGAGAAAHAGVTLEIRLVTSVIFRKGAVQTGITLGDLTATAHGDSLVVRAGMDRVGNAAYLGTGYFDLLDGTGATVRQWSSPLAVYYPINRRFVFPLDSLAPGDYVLRMRAEAVRPDIEEGRVLSAAPVADSIPLRVD